MNEAFPTRAPGSRGERDQLLATSPVEGRYLARLMCQPSHHTRLPPRPLRGLYESRNST